jgi:hypothetical protein
MTVEWGWQKAVLLFLGLLTKALAANPPLPVAHGELIQVLSQKVWFAFDGAFLYLLRPPAQKKESPIDSGPTPS